MLVMDAAIAGDWDAFWDALAHLAQPALVLAYFSLAYITRMTRAFMLDALSGEYIITARAKGLSATRILWRHAFGNIAVPSGDGAGAGLCRASRRRGDHRDGVLLARSRPLSHGIAAERRHECGAWRDAGGRAGLPGPEPAGGRAVPSAGPARAMSASSSREWLLTRDAGVAPQAAWGRRYRGWLQFRANGLAMVGLVRSQS